MGSFKENSKIARILASLFLHTSTSDEETAYHTWLKERDGAQEMSDRILDRQTYDENERLTGKFSSQAAWRKIYPLLGGGSSHPLPWKRICAYAALVLLLLVPASVLVLRWNGWKEHIGEIRPGTSGGELTLGDGTTFRLFENALPEDVAQVFRVDSKGLDYQTPANKPQIHEIRNTLHTLHSMECQVILSDGTKVRLNAESRLTYPVCFSGKERVVQVDGEAFFDVAPDKEHPFIVEMSHSTVRVTGTSFNVRAYADEKAESVTLVSGTVKVSNGEQEFDLIPSQHYTYDKNTQVALVADVKTDLYTSWASGSFMFMNVPLEDVMSYLSKWYGFQYRFDDESSKHVCIGAYLNRYANMNPIIDMITGLNLVDISQRNGVLHIAGKQ